MHLKTKQLTLKQNNDRLLSVGQMHQIWLLLHSIEGIQKTLLIHGHESPFDKTEQRKKSAFKKEFKAEYALLIERIDKQSPITIVLGIKACAITVQLLDLYFSENLQQDSLRKALEKLGVDLSSNDESRKLWKRIWKGVKHGKTAIKAMDLTFSLTN